MSISESYDKKVQESAENALRQLAELPAEQQQQACAARTQLMHWLSTMDDIFRHPEQGVTDDMADTACTLFATASETAAGRQPEPAEAWTAMGRAFLKLPEAERQNFMAYILGRTLKQHARGATLLSRQPGEEAGLSHMWEGTGLWVDRKAVLAKVGKVPAQPVGFQDDLHYVNTEASRLFWLREFGIAMILPFGPAFDVLPLRREEYERDHSDILSEDEKERMKEVLGWFDEELLAYQTMIDQATTDDGARAEIEDRIRETVKLARVRLPRYERELEALEKKHPELGELLSLMDPIQLLLGSQEMLRLYLSSTTVAEGIHGSIMAVSTEPEKLALATRQQMARRLRELLPTDDGPYSPTNIEQLINQALVFMPGLKPRIDRLDPTPTTLELGRQLLSWLEEA